MSVLLSHDGPFAGSQDEKLPGEPLPYKRPHSALFGPDWQPAGIYNDSEDPDWS